MIFCSGAWQKRKASGRERNCQQNILETVPTSEDQQAALAECFENRKKHRKKAQKLLP